MSANSDAFNAQAEVVRSIVRDGYQLFGRRSMAPGFERRCSPLGYGTEIAPRMSGISPQFVDEQDMAIYSFKALYTMGDEDDLLHFLPRIFELEFESVLDPLAEWNRHDTLWLKKVTMLRNDEIFKPEELIFVDRFVDSLWLLVLLISRERWHRIGDFLNVAEELHPVDRYLDAWLDATRPEVLEPLLVYATDPLVFPEHVRRSDTHNVRLREWFDSEPVLNKIVPLM